MRAVATGQAVAEIDGQESPTSVQRVDNQIVVQVGPINATIASVNGKGQTAALDNEGNVRLRPGDSVRIKASGFEPDSIVELWLFSTPVRLGTATVAADGSMVGDFTVPQATATGAHRIAIVARTSDGKAATLAIGILVGEWEKSTDITVWLIVLPIVAAVVGALVLPATRRRRRTRAVVA